MAEVFVEFTEPVVAEDGQSYIARACGSEMADGMWQGWVEFVPINGEVPIRTGRETTQPNRIDTEYWATGLTPVYLEGALQRALNPLPRLEPREIAAPFYSGPDTPRPRSTESVLNPFSVYRKGERLLRRQLAALSAWHLVNIIRDWGLSDANEAMLNSMTPYELIELIIDAVRRAEAAVQK